MLVTLLGMAMVAGAAGASGGLMVQYVYSLTLPLGFLCFLSCGSGACEQC